MSSNTVEPTSEFIRNIEAAIKEHGTMACPNPRCYDKLVSKKKWNSNNGKFLEYFCQNPNCAYHLKKHIPLPMETGLSIESLEDRVETISYNKIFTFVGVVLFGILAYTGYHLFSINQYIKNERSSVEVSNPTPSKATENISTLPDLEERTLDELSPKGAPVKPALLKNEVFELSDYFSQTRTWVQSKNYAQGKLNFKRMLQDDKYHNALLSAANNEERDGLLQLIGNDYQDGTSQFSYHLLETQQGFELLQTFLRTFDLDKKYYDVYLGKAYLNFPNFSKEKISSEERRKMQLLALQHYLTAAKENKLGDSKASAIKAMNEISKTYRILKYNPKKGKWFVPIETLIKNGDAETLQVRIDYVNMILERLS